jgi:kynurenine 3-monooxygenase
MGVTWEVANKTVAAGATMADEARQQQTQDAFEVMIVGAGLAGCLTAVLLAQQNSPPGRRPLHVTLVEYRVDPRACAAAVGGRSINLALSTRGLTALAAAGLADAAHKLGTPMHGRCVHDAKGKVAMWPYGTTGQHLLSVSRSALNALLLDACEAQPHGLISLVFGAKVTDVDLDASTVTTDGAIFHADLIIGADGTYSRVRAALSRVVPRFDTSREHIAAAYKEFCIPAKAAAVQNMPREFLHVWPRQSFMLIALPNADGSFTATLFMDAVRLEKLHDAGEAAVASFFKAEFPDAVTLMPDVADQFITSATPPLLTIRCNPYHYKDRAVVIGDAAHAIVPFYGQGCNAAFEDCVHLATLLDKRGSEEAGTNVGDLLQAFSTERKPNADAIADLAIEHYHDMASKSASYASVLRRRLEVMVHRVVPSSTFMPLYSMVTFSTIPYAVAAERAARQDKFISAGVNLGIGLSISAAVAALAFGIMRSTANRT